MTPATVPVAAPEPVPRRSHRRRARPVVAAGRVCPSATIGANAPLRSERSLAAILLLAMVGGFILNGMPCVLPILSLKLFGLVKAAGQSRASVRAGAVATATGIVLSFWALALAALAARSAGAAIGWGVQFQQPGFVAFLAVVILLFSLNLWGLFEIPLPARLVRLADSGGGEGLGGHFASGLFATLMATPCSAPFLGTALSFALGQTAGVIFATLTAVGVGLALPYLLLAAWPGFVRHLPRPGAWMDTLRGTMGFLLAVALVWLLYVLQAQVAAEFVAFFQLALLALGLVVWLAGRARLGGAGRRLGWVAALGLGLAAVVLVADAPAAAARSAASGTGANVIAWQPFDRAEAERLATDGRLVFLDITADWCVTCKVNERVVLHTPTVAGAFRRLDVVAMKADWTNRDDGIAAFLAEHGRYGIPFYMLYRPGQPPHVFGELITQQGVVDVLEAAAADAPPAG
jgi:suppressor for copper-sensitivity B